MEPSTHNPSAMIPKSDLEVLSQLIDDEDGGRYRIRGGPRVYHLSITADAFDDETMGRPYLLIPSLPDFPSFPWTRMHISRDHDGSLNQTLSSEPLPCIATVWHPRQVDVLALPRRESLRPNVHEVEFEGQAAIVKIACFDEDFPRIETETVVYKDIATLSAMREQKMAPEVLAQVTENGRVVGLLLEKISGRFAGIEDRERCERALRGLHAIRVVHGDVNRYNFIVEDDGGVRIVDFEHAEQFDQSRADAEIASLSSELVEETGRGGPPQPM